MFVFLMKTVRAHPSAISTLYHQLPGTVGRFAVEEGRVVKLVDRMTTVATA